jgi:hypothetical protein
MGLFSKLWKGVKKTFKTIFKPIKKAFKAFGKFMNKIGIVGQIAMSFILPGIGNALLSTFGKAAGWLASGSLGAVGEAAGWVLGKAVEFGRVAVQGYKTVTGAITDFIGTTGKYVGNKLGITNFTGVDTLSQAFGKEGWGGRLTDSFSKLGNTAKEFWDTDIKGAIPGGIAPSTVKNQELSSQTPIEEYTMEVESQMQSQLNSDKPYPDVFQKQGQGLLSKPIETKVTDVTTSAAVETAATSTDKGWLETLTGEKTFGDVGRKLAAETKEYAYAAPGKALSSAVTTGTLQAAGFAPKPPGAPGPEWGPRVSFEAPSKSYGVELALQPVGGIGFMDFANAYAQGGEEMGTYGGQGFYSEYMRRFAA